jgi:hypothetical protein
VRIEQRKRNKERTTYKELANVPIEKISLSYNHAPNYESVTFSVRECGKLENLGYAITLTDAELDRIVKWVEKVKREQSEREMQMHRRR